MGYSVSMDKAGRIVIPKEVRDRIGADETTRFHLEVILDHLELTPARTEDEGPKVFKEGRMLVISTGGQPFSAVDSLHELREERLQQVPPDTGEAP